MKGSDAALCQLSGALWANTYRSPAISRAGAAYNLEAELRRRRRRSGEGHSNKATVQESSALVPTLALIGAVSALCRH
jgi:hypothetical protein